MTNSSASVAYPVTDELGPSLTRDGVPPTRSLDRYPLVSEGPPVADGLDTRSGGGPSSRPEVFLDGHLAEFKRASLDPVSEFSGSLDEFLMARQGTRSTGLVLEGRTQTDPNGVGWTLRDDECPLDGALSIDYTTGEVAWRPTCKNARCPRCSRQVSAQTFALARRMADEKEHLRFITLTRAPEGWDETRQAMNVWLQFLRRAGYVMNVLWVVEEGSDTGMKHVHIVQWGSFIPKAVLSDSWPYGSTQIEAARAATDYLSKGVLRYVAKGIDGGRESLESHMNLNGGRAAHWSTRFFDGKGRNAYRQDHPLPGIYFVRTVVADRRPGFVPAPGGEVF